MKDSQKFVNDTNARIDELVAQDETDRGKWDNDRNVSYLDSAEPWMWIHEIDHTPISDNGEDAVWELEDGSCVEWKNVERRYYVVEVK